MDLLDAIQVVHSLVHSAELVRDEVPENKRWQIDKLRELETFLRAMQTCLGATGTTNQLAAEAEACRAVAGARHLESCVGKLRDVARFLDRMCETKPAVSGTKYVSPAEFLGLGLLQEVNRQVLHPCGFALEVVVEADGTARFGDVQDHRDQRGGYAFASEVIDRPEAREKYERVQVLREKNQIARKNELGEVEQPVPQHHHEHLGFKIAPKQDFGPGPGYYIEGEYVKEGYVVVENGCNVMPGATWFRTVERARQGIDDFLAADRDGPRFWEIRRARLAQSSL